MRDIGFRTRFNAAIIAVRRGGVPLEGKIGDMILERGDTLLLDTNEKFLSDGEAREQFDVISRVQDSRPPNHRKHKLLIGIVLAMILAIAFGTDRQCGGHPYGSRSYGAQSLLTRTIGREPLLTFPCCSSSEPPLGSVARWS